LGSRRLRLETGMREKTILHDVRIALGLDVFDGTKGRESTACDIKVTVHSDPSVSPYPIMEERGSKGTRTTSNHLGMFFREIVPK